MTIGIAMTLEDGVLFVADSRHSHLPEHARPPDDRANKIFRVSPKIAAITFGIVHVTDAALDLLKASLSGDAQPHDIYQTVESSIYKGWIGLLSRLSTDVDLKHELIRAGLVVGGIASGQPFLAGFIKSHKSEDSTIATEPFMSIVLGGERQNSTQEFNSRARLALQQFSARPGRGVMNNLVRALLEGAAQTVRLVAEKDPTVGGAIHYAVIRKGYRYKTGQY